VALFLPGMKSKKSWENIMCDCLRIKEHNTVVLPYSPLKLGITVVLLPLTHSTFCKYEGKVIWIGGSRRFFCHSIIINKEKKLLLLIYISIPP
jgi:hypothetical protein